MKSQTTRWPAWVVVAVLISAGLGSVLARGDDAKTDEKPRNTWVPPEEDRAAYRDIVDYNIFSADRRRIAEQVDRNRNPQTPRETPRETPRTVAPPPDPDSFWRLAGITHAPDGVVAFIEHTTSGELSRLTGPAEFSKGEVTAIGYDAVMYVVADQQRVIRIGETLLGERVVPAGGATRTSSGSSSKSNLSPAERLRLLKEERAREQGTAPPADGSATPEATQTPAKPGEAAPAPKDSSKPAPSPDTEPNSNAEPGDGFDLLGDDPDPSIDGRDADANTP